MKWLSLKDKRQDKMQLKAKTLDLYSSNYQGYHKLDIEGLKTSIATYENNTDYVSLYVKLERFIVTK